ncbi:MAG: hypothetical protein VYA69_08070 [Gemmatimonadota bacterium]|nr:hypothetical protein [Gemmatimonadota bacterium]
MITNYYVVHYPDVDHAVGFNKLQRDLEVILNRRIISDRMVVEKEDRGALRAGRLSPCLLYQ